MSHDLDWAFGDVGERNPFFAADTHVEEVEEVPSTKKSVWASPDIARSLKTPTVWRPGRTELDAGVSEEDGAVAAITFGRRELEIPDKKPRGGVLHFPGSDTLDDSSFRG